MQEFDTVQEIIKSETILRLLTIQSNQVNVPKNPVINIKLGQVLLVNAHLLLSLHVSHPPLHFVPGQVVQFTLPRRIISETKFL